MSDRKRGPYSKYNRGDNPTHEIPRQTKWNRSNSLGQVKLHCIRRISTIVFDCVFNSFFLHLKMNSQPSVLSLLSSLIGSNNVQHMPAENSISELDVTEMMPIDVNEFENNCDDIDDANDVAALLEQFLPDFDQNIFDFEEIEVNDESSEFEPHTTANEDFRKLHPSTDCTVIDAYSMIYTFAIRHNLTWEAIEDLALLGNNFIGSPVLSSSKYKFKKKMNAITINTMVKHIFCQNCGLYFGTTENIARLPDGMCVNCHVKIETDTKYKKNHFIAISIKNQLRDVLERNSDFLNFEYDLPDTNISDVHDSLFFRNLRKKVGNIPILTLTFSTDGAARFKSTKEKSVWPLQFVVNEIDLQFRFKRENLLCAAISFGKTPNMQVFFKPFIDEINKINAEGGLSFTSKDNRTQTVKILPMIFTGDIPARADVLMKSHFNGYNGCTHCSHEGTLLGKQIRYCKRNEGPLRTNERVRADMLEAHISNSRVNGYKGLSPLLAFDYFDVVWQIGIDKMHNIDLGVTSLLFNFFLKSQKESKRYLVFFSFGSRFFF